MPRLALLFCLVFLCGCGNVRHLRELNPPANDFSSSLASEYKDYADSEMEQGRWLAAEHFAGKGLKALKGKAVEPETPSAWAPEAARGELSEARAQLMRFSNDDMKRVNPQKLARAQLLFDCWQHALIRRMEREKASCAEEFQATLTELQDIADALAYGQETRHEVHFSPKSARLDAPASAVIDEIAQRLPCLPQYRVQMVAYTGVGSAQRRLTEKRLRAVRAALVKAGVSEKHILTRKEGGAKAVMLRRDGIATDPKIVAIIVKTHPESRRDGGR